MSSLIHSEAKSQDELSPHQQEFLENFEWLCRLYLALYFSLDDPPEPAFWLWSTDFMEDLLAAMPEQFRKLADQLTSCPVPDEVRRLDKSIHAATSELRVAMREWFELAGYDYEHIPLPPTSSVQKVKLKGGFKDHKTAYQFGQIIYVGSSSVTHGWAELYRASDGKRICSFHPRTSGICWNRETTETVWRVATDLANLTDWDEIENQPAKVQRAIGKRVFQIAEPLRSYFRIN